MEDRLEDIQPDQKDIWSVSKLKIMGGCGKRYKFKYIDKVKEDDTAALAFGSAVHKCLERMHKESIWDDSQLQRMWSDTWFKYQFRIDWDKEMARKSTYDNRGIKILEKYKEDYQDDTIFALETKFMLEPADGLPVLRGIIDKIIQLPDGNMAVIDYKTEKNPPDPFLLRADPQFTIYYSAVKQIYGQSPILGLHHLLSGKVYWTERTDDDMEVVRRMLKEAKFKIKNKMFDRNIGYSCRYCPFKEQCLGPLMVGNVDE